MDSVKIKFLSPWNTCHTKVRDTKEIRKIVREIDGVVDVRKDFDYSFIFRIGECFSKEVVEKEIITKVNLYQKKNGVFID